MENGTSLIRPMAEQDVAAIMPMEIDSFPDPWSPLAFLADLEHNPRAMYRVLWSAGAIRGYIGFWKTPFGLDILKLCVAPNARGCGFGAALLANAVSELEADQVARVLVRTGNEPALSLYERFGFTKMGVYERYYTGPTEDAVVMAFTGPARALPRET